MNSLTTNTCPICKDVLSKTTNHNDKDRLELLCSNCGQYEISGTAYVALGNHEKDYKLSFAVRRRFDRGDHVYINTTNREVILSGIVIPVKVKELAELVLTNVFTDEENKSKELSLSSKNCIRFGIESDTKMRMVLDYIESEGWFTLLRFASGGAHLSLTGKGISHAEDIINPNYNSNQVFVAMSFNPELNIAYSEAIQEAVRLCKLNPIRIDDTDFNDEIIANVRNHINQSRFVIADFTDNRPGVYFEAGYAIGRNIPVIYCCRESDKDEIHFDINHNKFIYWNELDGFKTELVKRITNTGLRD